MSSDPQVLIVMGSNSDLSLVKPAAEVLMELDIGREMHILSAHRTPERAGEMARGARGRGIRVIIAAAGGAAHLAGAMAANTTLPVIGIPIFNDGALAGLDALLATVQMPAGVPVATVAVNGARNAGILAAQILAASDEEIAARLMNMRKTMTAKVEAADRELQEREGQHE